MSHEVVITKGMRLLMLNGPVLVVAIGRFGVRVKTVIGDEEEVSWDRLEARETDETGVQGVHLALEPWWSSLPLTVRLEALARLEVVLEILTGYRDGLADLARPGEPFHPFGSGFGVTVTVRIRLMARQLSVERSADRIIMRRVQSGELITESVSESTVRLWVKAWQREGLRGLIDGRRTKRVQGFDALDPRFLRIAQEVLSRYDGDISIDNQNEVERQIRVQLKQERITAIHLPQRLLQEYLSSRMRAVGNTTRQNRAKELRKNSSRRSYPAIHPGHLAIDVTRWDGFVIDPLTERVYSVEVITVVSVPTRVIVALRVVPRSATSLEASLCLFDAMRPMSMLVEGDDEITIDSFRWCGLPVSLDFDGRPIYAHRSPRPQTGRAIRGQHIKPAVTPMSIRADNGSIFLSAEFRALLTDFGVDLLPSRGSRPIDNAHVERWHESLQRACQQIPGFKGRRVTERGRMVMVADRPLLTARELEEHLHRFVALDYHRTPHDGIRLPGMESGHFTPLERFDMLLLAAGNLAVPQHPDLVYQFLPKRWLKIGHAGVEYRGLTYDGEILDELRQLRTGTFRAGDDRMPFLYDHRERSHLWIRHPFTDRVHQLEWRESHLLHAPLTDVVIDEARRLVRERGGNNALSKRKVMLEIVDEVTQLTAASNMDEWRAKLIAARVRHEKALLDHAEAAAATRTLEKSRHSVLRLASVELVEQTEDAATSRTKQASDDEPWPDYRRTV